MMKTLLFFLTLAVGLLPSCIAELSKSATAVEQPSSKETGASKSSEHTDRWSRIKEINYGGKQADRAEIAGMMATYMMDPYKASYIYIVNEYRGDELIRQNGCANIVNNKMNYDMLVAVCLDMSLFKKVTGELTFDKFYLFMINYKWIETLSVSQHRKIVRPTMSTIISNFNNDANFGIEFQSGIDTTSKPVRISLKKTACEYNSQLGKTDCIWSPGDERLRKIEPYTWMPEPDF